MKIRDILFRGKKKYQDLWVEGGFYYLKYPAIITCRDTLNSIAVEEETVGMYTTLSDRNGRKIFEGDFCRFYGDEGYADYEVFFTNSASDCQAVGFYVRQLDTGATDTFDAFFASNCEVIGNIHDNPELLKCAATDTNVGSKDKV